MWLRSEVIFDVHRVDGHLTVLKMDVKEKIITKHIRTRYTAVA